MPIRIERGVRAFLITTDNEVRTIAEPTRMLILENLRHQPSSAKRLSEKLDMTHGRVGHHFQILESNGLIEVVDTRQVRSMTEKIYAPTFDMMSLQFHEDGFDPLAMFFQLCGYLAAPPETLTFASIRSLETARVTEGRAKEFGDRLLRLIDEFAAETEEGASVFAMSGAVYQAAIEVDDA